MTAPFSSKPMTDARVLFSVRRLCKVFPGGLSALSGISVSIFEKECLVIAGSNGSGKTLLMRLLIGLTEPTSGEIFFRGRPLRLGIGELRRCVGLVFQDPSAQIVGETVAEDAEFGPKNLGLPKSEAAVLAESALTAVGLWEKRAIPPRRLSGGEKRRLAVAGILAMGCSAVIFDEPFANLDWVGVTQTLESIRKLKSEGKTVIILTHELEKVLAYADRLIILHKGAIRDDGGPEEVLGRLDPAYGVRDPRVAYTSVEDCTWLTG
ncbi:MAG: energy-coupling factor ABC transporter ATP-binding protein [Spirochaetaceae bacterium]|jgi:biotin transport system ATP-binding protein|nr:energy-coupling factor ABC transporter ATP-binding protein [Spirochaetaceae bacterium]